MNDTPRLPEARLGELIDGLVTQVVCRHRLSPRRPVRGLACRTRRHDGTRRLVAAGIGRGDNHHLRRDVRGDAIRWLDRESQAQRRYLDAMGELQQTLNQALFLGLFEYEAHFATTRPAPSIGAIWTASGGAPIASCPRSAI